MTDCATCSVDLPNAWWGGTKTICAPCFDAQFSSGDHRKTRQHSQQYGLGAIGFPGNGLGFVPTVDGRDELLAA